MMMECMNIIKKAIKYTGGNGIHSYIDMQAIQYSTINVTEFEKRDHFGAM